MTFSNFLHCFHSNEVIVDSCIRFCVNRSHFMLSRSNLIMLCCGCDAKFPKFSVEILHISAYIFFDSAKILIFKFLSLWSRSAEKCSSGILKILAGLITVFAYKEIFLLRTYRSCNSCSLCLRIKKFNNSESFIAQCIH